MPEKPEKLSITLNTESPIWTGGDNTGVVDRLHETGVIGSLRWWFEILVRGVGGIVSNPTGGSPAKLRFDEYEHLSDEMKNDPEALKSSGLCDVSLIFGATNWKRRFRLEIQTLDSVSNFEKKGCSGSLILNFTPLTDNKMIFNPAVIEGLIQFIADWGALGAKGKMGFGLFKLENRIDTRALYDYLQNINESIYTIKPTKQVGTEDYPSLENMFFARIGPKNGKKFCCQKPQDELLNLQHYLADNCNYIMGTKNKASQIRMCGPYENEHLIRLWGWVPDNQYGEMSRSEARIKIFDCLRRMYRVDTEEWLNSEQYNSITNAVSRNKFLKTMLGIEEKSA